MTIRKRKGGTYLLWYQDWVAKGRARKRAGRPKRGILSVRIALNNLRLRYCQEVSMWSPHHVGKQGNLDGGLLWNDFVVKGKRPVVVLLDDPKKRRHEYEKRYLEAKKQELIDRDIPLILLPVGMTSQEYQIVIYREMKKKGA